MTHTSDADIQAKRILARLPTEITRQLDPDALAKLARYLAPRADHLMDFRASSKLLGKRYYVRLMIGEERRNLKRLMQERQISAVHTLILLCVIGWGLTTIIGGGSILIVYLLKSWAGIDLLDGPSPLHSIFFD